MVSLCWLTGKTAFFSTIRRPGGDCPFTEESSVPMLQEPKDISSADNNSLALSFTDPAGNCSKACRREGMSAGHAYTNGCSGSLRY